MSLVCYTKNHLNKGVEVVFVLLLLFLVVFVFVAVFVVFVVVIIVVVVVIVFFVCVSALFYQSFIYEEYFLFYQRK